MIQVNSSQTERIIRRTEATGAEFISSKIALERCLQICLKWYGDALIYTSRSSQRMQRLAALRLQSSVQDLLAQLATDRPAYHRWFLPSADVLSKQLLDLSDSIDTALGLHSDSEPQSGLESDFVDYLGYQDHFKL